MTKNFSNANPQYRDSVFRDYFNDKVRLLSLCNALLDTNYTDPESVEINTLPGNFFSAQKNDLSCRIGNNILILAEHQTSINPNMAFRCLSYAVQLLNNMITNKESLYRDELVIFPAPQCFVFYDGDDAEPLTKEIRLSDSFYPCKNKPELVVTSFNINFGLNQPLLKKCSFLNDYSTLIGKVKQGMKEKLSRRQAIIQAVNWCIKSGVMTDYLTRKRDEVFSMLDLQWDFDEAKAAWGKQVKESIAQKMIDDGEPFEKIRKWTELPLEHIKELAQKINSAKGEIE